MTLGELLTQLLGPLSSLVLVLFILYGGYKRWWVFGWYATELKNHNVKLENRLDLLRNETRTVTSLAEKSVSLVEKKAEVISE